MSGINSSILRPYFKKNDYSRVIDSNFNEFTRVRNINDEIEELIREYRELFTQIPPEMHFEIARLSGRLLGIDIEAEDFKKINELNAKIDELETQLDQQDLIDAPEHPHFRNGTFINGGLVFYYMQRGYKRAIQNLSLFKILFNMVYKIEYTDQNIKDKVPFPLTETLLKIPTAIPITSEVGKETFNLSIDIPTIGSFVFSITDSEVFPVNNNLYRNQKLQTPSISQIKEDAYIELEKGYENKETSKEIFNEMTKFYKEGSIL